MGTSSSPVASTATRGRANTRGRPAPSAASSPMVAGSSVAPARHRPAAPAASSEPRATTLSPAATARWMTTVSGEAGGRSVCSTITTASAPAGSGAPVMISTQVPGATVPANTAPAATSPIRFSVTGRIGTGPGHVRRPHGESVARGAMKRRLVAIGAHVGRQHPPLRLAERELLAGPGSTGQGSRHLANDGRARLQEREGHFRDPLPAGYSGGRP